MWLHLKPEFYDCIAINASSIVTIFTETSLFSLVFPQGNDVDREEKVVKLDDRSMVWKVFPAKLRLPKGGEGVGFWFRSLDTNESRFRKDPIIRQIAWTKPIYSSERDFSLLFALDVNFHLYAFNSELKLIKDLGSLYKPPSWTSHFNMKSELIEHVKSVSNLCFSASDSIGTEENKSIMVALGGRSSYLQLFQFQFSYPDKMPVIRELDNIELIISSKVKEVISLAWKEIKVTKSSEAVISQQMLLVGYSDGSLHLLPIEFTLDLKENELTEKVANTLKVMKKDFSPIQKISFSNIFVENSTELHYFDIDDVNIMVSCSSFTRPFQSSISVVRWLNHSLHLMTSSVRDEVKCWKVSENLDIDLVYEGEVMIVNQEKPISIYGMEVSPNDAALLIYSLNQTSLITLEINLWPLYPIQNALKCFDSEYYVWDLISKYNKKPLREIGEVIYNMKSTYFEKIIEAPLEQSAFIFYRMYQIIVLLCKLSTKPDFDEDQKNIYESFLSLHEHILFLFFNHININNLIDATKKGYVISAIEKESLWYTRQQMLVRLIKLGESRAHESVEMVVEKSNTSVEVYDDLSMDISVMQEIQEVNSFAFENNMGEIDVTKNLMFTPNPLQERFELTLKSGIISNMEFIDLALKDYFIPGLLCPFCPESIDLSTLNCKNEHFVDSCAKTFLPIQEISHCLLCTSCNLSSLDLRKFKDEGKFLWIYNDTKCTLCGEKIQSPDFL